MVEPIMVLSEFGINHFMMIVSDEALPAFSFFQPNVTGDFSSEFLDKKWNGTK